MRLFLLPVSTRRTLLYCERLAEPHGQQASLMDKAQTRAAKLWSDWERKPTGSWQHRIVSSGNKALRRIAFEEWGLKSVPPLSARRRVEAAAAANQDSNAKVSEATPIEVVYPASAIPAHTVSSLLTRLGTERETLHRQRLIWCFVGMPFTAPIGLVPLIPNIPFFYLAFRAWSHWRALSGGKHIQYLLQNDRLVYSSSPVLDAIYVKERAASTAASMSKDKPIVTLINEASKDGKDGEEGGGEEERLLISHPSGSKAIADAFDAPALELELERAIWQVETALEKEGVEKKAAQQQQQRQQRQDQQVQRLRPQKEKQPPSQQPTAPPTKTKDKNE